MSKGHWKGDNDAHTQIDYTDPVFLNLGRATTSQEKLTSDKGTQFSCFSRFCSKGHSMPAARKLISHSFNKRIQFFAKSVGA
jgi:hypothetical protein